MKKSFLVYVLCGVGLALGIPAAGLSQDIQPVITPNAMIILDTSYSMNYQNDGNWPAASIVKVDAKGYREKDEFGNSVDTDYDPKTGQNYKFEQGGDHPYSKIYQAKLALKKVLNDIMGINIGFSTYGQSKTDRRRCLYVRKRQDWSGPTKTRCDWSRLYFRFKNFNDYHTSSITAPPPKGTFTFGGTPYSGLDKGSTVTLKNHTFDKTTVPPHPPGTFVADLNYTISNVTYNAELNNYTYDFKSDSHYHYYTYNAPYWVLTDDPDCNEVKKSFVCDSDSTFPKIHKTYPDYKTYWAEDRPGDKYPEDSSDVIPKTKWDCSGPNKTGKGSFGSLYDDYAWITFDNTSCAGCGTTCPDTWGGASNWDGSKAVTEGSSGYSAWSVVDKISKGYDVSNFSYPALGGKVDDKNPKPDIWSYYTVVGGNWPSYRKPSYYPSRDASDVLNNTPGKDDNHYFFVNFPPYDDSTDGYKTKKAILDLLDLTPVQNIETTNYHTKLPVKSGRFLDSLDNKQPDNSITPNTLAAPEAQTPLAASLRAARRYFEDYINTYQGGDAASKAKCRGNFVILLTDGLESCDYKDKATKDVDYDAAASAAKELYDLGVITFVIGFMKDTGGNESALKDIATKGSDPTHPYPVFWASDVGTLSSQINAIFQLIFDSLGRGNPAVSGRISQGSGRFYRGFFGKDWEGHLSSYALGSDGAIGAELWDAGKVMNLKKKRADLYSWVEDKPFPERVDFRTKEDELYVLVNPLAEDIDGDTKVDKKDPKTVIDFTINPGFDSKKYKGYRSGEWLLGDIYHSTPLVLSPSAFKFPDDKFPQKYSDFKTTWQGRKNTIYVGANDGMLHAFDEDGNEKWALLPRNILRNLKELRGKDHQFYVDSSPRMSDAYVQGKWRTVILSGERSGGMSYFCVDVTDPADPIILWERSDAAMGYTWSRPEIGWVRIGGKEKFVVFVGGGFSTTANVGNTFYVLDMEDGSIKKTFTVGDASNKVVAGATGFDSDSDGRIDGVYFGDTSGVLWKIKIDLEEDIDKWTLVKLFDPGTKHPIYYPPVVTRNNQKKILVYFGQGDESNIFEDKVANSFFEIEDKGVTGVLSWEKLLEMGEKVLASPAFANNIVYFTTFKYTGMVAGNCAAGVGRLYGLSVTREGVPGNGAALYLDPITKEPFSKPKEYFNITDYFPKLKGVPSAPIVVMDKNYTYIYFTTSGSGSGGVGVNPPAGQARLKYWREKWDIN